MSLKESDWKAVLNKPKNVGLKTFGGTGISGLLRTYGTADKTYAGSKTESNNKALSKVLTDLKTQCNVVQAELAGIQARAHLKRSLQQNVQGQVVNAPDGKTLVAALLEAKKAFQAAEQEVPQMKAALAALDPLIKNGDGSSGAGISTAWHDLLAKYVIPSFDMP